MVRSPERKNLFSRFPSGLPGVGVVERASSVLRLENDVFFPLSQDMFWFLQIDSPFALPVEEMVTG
jgi:hypothetical protein